MKTHRMKRIVTKTEYQLSLAVDGVTPQDLLAAGTATYTLGDKVRVFMIRDVVYDEGHTPLYSLPTLHEKKYESLAELYADHPSHRDTIILDGDHCLDYYQPNPVELSSL